MTGAGGPRKGDGMEKHQRGGDDPTRRRPLRVYPVMVVGVTVPRADADEARALVYAAAKKAGLNATRWAADRLLEAARQELGEERVAAEEASNTNG